MAQFAAFGRPVAAGEGGLEHAMADLRAEYERALRLNADGALDAAEQRYESILRHGLLGSDSADIPPSVRHLKALTLRNLGSLRVTVGRLPSGLNCLIRAAETEMGGWADPGLLMQIARCARDLELLALSRQCLERCLALDPDDVLALETLLDVLVDCADEYAYRRAFTYASALQQRLWRPTNFGSLSAVVPRLDDIDVGDLRFSKRRRVDMEEVEPAMLAPLDIVWDVDNDDLATWDAFIEFVVEQLELLAGKESTQEESLAIPVRIAMRFTDAVPMAQPSSPPTMADESCQQAGYNKHPPMDLVLPGTPDLSTVGHRDDHGDMKRSLRSSRDDASATGEAGSSDDNDDEDSSDEGSSSASSNVAPVWLAFLERATPRESVSLSAEGVLNFCEDTSAPPSPVALSPCQENVGHVDGIGAFLNRVNTGNSGIADVCRRLWSHVAREMPAGITSKRLMALFDANSHSSVPLSDARDLVLGAELRFDHYRCLADSGANCDAAMVEADHLVHLIPYSLGAVPPDVSLRIAWLSGQWSMAHQRRLVAREQFHQCMRAMTSHSAIVLRPYCRHDGTISPDTVRSKLETLRLWDLCESFVTKPDPEAVESLSASIMDDASDWAGIPAAVQTSAFRTMLGATANAKLVRYTLARLIAAEVSPVIHAPVPGPAALAGDLLRWIAVIDSIGADDADSCTVPDRLGRPLIHALCRCVASATTQRLPGDFLAIASVALVVTASTLDPNLKHDPLARYALFGAGHACLADRDACRARQAFYLHRGLDDILLPHDDDECDGFAQEYVEARRVFQVGACYACLYGRVDPRHARHGNADDAIDLGEDARSPSVTARLFEYSQDVQRYFPKASKRAADADELAGRVLDLLQALRKPVGLPPGLHPPDDFVKAFLESGAEPPPLVMHNGNDALYDRFYDVFGGRLVDDLSLCSFATRVPAASLDDVKLSCELLQADVRLHPLRIRSWHRLAWTFIAQCNSFLSGVHASVADAGDDLQHQLAPLFHARRCLHRTLRLIESQCDSIPEFNVLHDPSTLCITRPATLMNVAVIDLRLLEFASALRRSGKPYDALNDQGRRLSRALDRIGAESPRVAFLRALTIEYESGVGGVHNAHLLEHYARASTTIPDALYALHATRLRIGQSEDPDWDLLNRFPFERTAVSDLRSLVQDVAKSFLHCCQVDSDAFRPALRLAQLALEYDVVDRQDALNEVGRFASDKTRQRKARARRGSLAPDATDGEFVRALCYDAALDTADDDCLMAFVLLAKSLHNWDELDAAYYNCVKSRRDKHAALIYASALIDTFNDFVDDVGHVAADAEHRDNLFKRAFECCLDLTRGKRGTTFFLPALLVLPLRISNAIKDGVPAASRASTVDADEVRRARDWCVDQQSARSIRSALQRLPVPSKSYDLNEHLVPLGTAFASFNWYL
ncbi:Uncharacterized protein PBTT_00097 [Plasmodiophora brassicae]